MNMSKKKPQTKQRASDSYVTNNMEVHRKENYVLVSVNPGIYPLDVVYSAAYVLIDRAYIIIDGNPNEEIIVELRPKAKEDVELLGRDLNNELLNYAVYQARAEKNKTVRDAIVQRALLTHGEPAKEGEARADPEELAVPWDKNKE